MNLLQKCFIGSTAIHLLLLFLFTVGSLLTAKPHPPPAHASMPLIQLVAPFPEGPKPGPPQSQPQTTSTAEKASPAPAASVEETRKLPNVSTRLVLRDHNTNKKTEPAPDTRPEQINQAVNRIFKGLSSATSIELSTGQDQGSQADAYADLVKFFYTQSWKAPEDGSAGDAIAKVSVTIGHEGEVLKSSIVKPSGIASLDQSVQRALDRVTSIEPFGPGAKDRERTYVINFSLRMLN